MASNTNIFGDLLRRFRDASQLTGRELACKAFLSPSYLSQLERGRRKPSAPVLVHCLAVGLGLDDAATRSLYEAAGFIPPHDELQQDSSPPAVTTRVQRLISEVLTLHHHHELVIEDLLARLRGWDLYEEALNAVEYDRYRACQLAQRILADDQASLLIRRSSNLYGMMKEASDIPQARDHTDEALPAKETTTNR